MSVVDLSNFAAILLQSTDSRAGTPDGNIYFNTTSGEWEAIPVDELATVIYPLGHPSYTDGTTPVPNPLIRADGIKFEGIYAFENQERASSVVSGEGLRKFDRFTKGTFKFGGAYLFVNGRVPATAADRTIIRGSGWEEQDTNNVPIQKWFGNKGLSNIDATSQPYFQQSEQGTAQDFLELGQIDESIKVYQDLDGNEIPDIDLTTYEAVSIRTYGNTHDRKNTVDDLGIAELGGYSTGFALNEGPHLTTDPITDHPIADVYDTPTGVWATMALNHIPSPVAKTGEFSNDDGTLLFSWELINDNTADLDDIVAWLDAFAINSDEADGLAVNTGHLGRDIETWYYYNAAGQVVTKSGVTPASEGLYINNVPTADQQRVVMTADDGTIKAYSFSVSIEAEIGSVAKADVNAWYHSWFFAAYNTSGAIVVQDTTPAEVKGLASSADGNNKIIFPFDYTGDTNGGPADSDKDCVFLCEGDGGATQAKTLYTITKVTTVAFSCAPATENNA